MVNESPSDIFDITESLIAVGQTDLSKMYIVVVPFSLSATLGGQKAIIDTNTFGFNSIEFFSTQ